jgi:hypothetical protein
MFFVFTESLIKKELLICSSDFYNIERKWCSERKFSLIDICNELKIKVDILDYNSCFYKINHLKEVVPHRVVVSYSFDRILSIDLP